MKVAIGHKEQIKQIVWLVKVSKYIDKISADDIVKYVFLFFPETRH